MRKFGIRGLSREGNLCRPERKLLTKKSAGVIKRLPCRRRLEVAAIGQGMFFFKKRKNLVAGF